MPGKKRKPNHREVLLFWETEIFNRNLGISEHGDAAFYFVDSVLRAYAVQEQAEADAKKAVASTERPLEGPSANENCGKTSYTLAEWAEAMETPNGVVVPGSVSNE